MENVGSIREQGVGDQERTTESKMIFEFLCSNFQFGWYSRDIPVERPIADVHRARRCYLVFRPLNGITRTAPGTII